MTRRISAAVALGVTIAVGHSARAFDCAKAATRTERMVCADPDLKNLDDRLERLYATALDSTEQSACVKAGERRWLTATRDRCATPACLREAYLKRLGTFAALQPGTDGIKGGDPPAVPRLRLFVPTVGPLEGNRVAAPVPFEGRGTIAYVLDKGGFVLRTADGGVHAIISDLAIEPATYVQLDGLKNAGTAVIVSGQHGRLDRTTLAFDNRTCIAVYEQPAANGR